ncbi:tail terminator [Gordonia phage Goib]|uniref:Tail terminator n=2 Tax=Vendettavirus vendetta TaxID=2049886 RepID=A0A160DFG3_9CAUD|nr:tail terminator [Gordonia phage Vendetta]YP_009275371.1 tail terminator [Gordonia phage Splinter]ANA85564.1 tail terminator [Gordonia phage Vendetta]ANA85643.1 tail terminator [Gordonia phage Splinter]WNO25761.1 tail terminator [Gordonia phage Goib]
MPELDPQAELIAVIGSGGWYATGELPEAVETRLPVVQVLGLPGTTTFEVWGGRTLGREVPFDVYAFAPTIEDAGDLARAVAGYVEGVHGALSLTVQTTPHEVSDYNPRVKRFLFTVAARYRR